MVSALENVIIMNDDDDDDDVTDINYCTLRMVFEVISRTVVYVMFLIANNGKMFER